MGNCEGHPRRPLRLLGRVCRCEIRSPSSPRAGGNEAGQGAATHVLPPRLRSASASRVDGGGQCLFTQHPLPPAGAAAPPQPALGGGGVRERGAGGSFATRRRQLQLGLGEQQAPEREGGDCRSGSRRPGRERSPWHLKRQARAPGARVLPAPRRASGIPALSPPTRAMGLRPDHAHAPERV